MTVRLPKLIEPYAKKSEFSCSVIQVRDDSFSQALTGGWILGITPAGCFHELDAGYERKRGFLG